MESEKKKKIDWRAPFVEQDKLSMGRLQHWIVFFIMCYKWILDQTVAETMMTVFMTLAMYNFGKKGVDAYNHWVDSTRLKKETEDEN